MTRAELIRIVEAIRSHARTGTKRGEIVPRRLADGRIGLRIHGVWPGARCGLEQGDTVLSLDGIPVNDTARLEPHVVTLSSASEITLEVERGGETIKLTYSVVD